MYARGALFALVAGLFTYSAQDSGGTSAAGQGTPATTRQNEISLFGRVVDGATGAPVPQATVILGDALRLGAIPAARTEPFGVIADGLGRFVFRGIPPGTYPSLTATAFGFITGSYGQSGATRVSMQLEVPPG